MTILISKFLAFCKIPSPSTWSDPSHLCLQPKDVHRTIMGKDEQKLINEKIQNARLKSVKSAWTITRENTDNKIETCTDHRITNRHKNEKCLPYRKSDERFAWNEDVSRKIRCCLLNRIRTCQGRWATLTYLSGNWRISRNASMMTINKRIAECSILNAKRN